VERPISTATAALGGLTAGAGLAFFLDPQSGRRRRHLVRDRTLGMARRTFRRATRTGRRTVLETEALAKKAVHLREQPKPDMTDETLAAKIMSEVFRDPELPKGDVNVNVEDGVAVLRGQVDRPEMIEDLVERVRKVKGVRDVENHLHVPS
jgi:osmotically-inducible protein OsmY